MAACDDRDEIRSTRVREFGATATQAHLAGLERIFGLLREHPAAGQQRSDYGPSVRGFSHRPHRVLCGVEVEGVVVVRILHAARDVRAILDRHR